jgi:hypothetical protein
MGVLFQLWLPWIESSLGFEPVRHDVEGAVRTWQGEDTIWLLPELTRVVRWVRQYAPGVFSTQVAIPARHLNVIDGFHVWENGLVFGPGSKLRFPESRIDGLLQEWLNVWRDGHVSLCEPAASVTIEVPRIPGDGQEAAIAFEEMTLHLHSGSSVPAWEEGGTIQTEWPIRGMRCPSVFPDAESREAQRQHLQLPSYRCAIQWPTMLSHLFPITCGGLDELVGQKQMVELAHMSHDNPESAFWEALQTASPYIT